MNKGSTLKVYRCQKCNWSDFFETKTCPRCQTETEIVTLSGRGKVATFTVIRYPPQGFEKDTPYTISIIELEGGPRVLGRITKSDQIQIGQTVQFVGNTGASLQFETT